MDRKSWIAVTLSIAGLIAYYWYYVKNYSAPQRPDGQKAVAAATATPTPASAGTAAPPTPTAPVEPGGPVISPKTESLFTKTAEYFFNNDTGGIRQVALYLHMGENMDRVTMNRDQAISIGALGQKPNEPWGGFDMKVDPSAGQAFFAKKEADGLEITKTFAVPMSEDKKNKYLVAMEVTFKNASDQEISRPEYYVSTGGAAPVHVLDQPIYTRFDWMHGGKMSNIDVNWFNAGSIPFVGIQYRAAQSEYNETKPDVTWAAAASQYFCTIVTSESKGVGVWATRFDTHKANSSPVYGIQGGLRMPGFKLAPGESVTQKFSIYAGPKELQPLRALGAKQDAVLNFGMFGIVSEILLGAMNFLNGIFHSYAAAIIVLTLIIKSLLWPVQNKATKEMRKMAALSPKMTEMREKYKDDPQKLNEEMMKLYREYGVNPFSGCLPMLIQIPIFFGFYAMLGSAIELRNSSFFWISDLSQPDTIARIPGINFPINLLPILMAGTMIWQMVISPKSGDAVQQRMLYFMPVLFLVFCYNYASGLALYWTTQNLFSIVQLYLTRNTPLPTLEKKSVIAKREADAAKKKKKKRL